MKTYTDVNITRARALAKRSTQYGYFHAVDAPTAYAWCPECAGKVTTDLNDRHNKYAIVRDLHAAVVEHLTSGDCDKHPDLG